MPCGQLVPVLVGVASVDNEQRPVSGEGVAVVFADRVAGRPAGDAAVPSRNRAGRVPCSLAPERGQVPAESGHLVCGDLGDCRNDEHASDEDRRDVAKCDRFLEIHGPDSDLPQNEYLMEAETKSLSLSGSPLPLKLV